ncbi:MAG: HEAT repeat domain-containing protein [Candidatus Thorarchaeota archaeon]
MKDLAIRYQDAVAERDYSTSSLLIEQALKQGNITDMARSLETIEGSVHHLTLEVRDHIFHTLGLWDVYFAVQMSSTDVLKLLKDQETRENARIFMVDFIRNLLKRKDKRFDQFCVNIQTVSKGHYAVLVPQILEERTEELLKCKIQFNEGPPPQYCTADLLDTYYGGKIVTATHGHRAFDIVVNEAQYITIRDSLASAGLEIDPMLVKMDDDEWEDYLQKRRKPERGKSSGELDELVVLHRVKSARSDIYSKLFRKQVAALNAIEASKTQLCNDILMDVITSPTHQLRMRALRLLSQTGDLMTLEFLADLMKNDRDSSIRKEAARVYSSLSSISAGLGRVSPPVVIANPFLKLSRINNILNTLISKRMPTTMIDETIQSIVYQGGSDSTEMLLRLFKRPQEVIRLAIIKASQLLDKQSAALIIKEALNDESEEIVRLAEKEIDARWSDAVWE